MKALCGCFLLLPLSGMAAVQEPTDDVGSPSWLVETFFTQAAVPNAADYYTGEMRHHLRNPAMGHYAEPGYTLTTRVLDSTEDETVYAICYDYPEPRQDRDWYAFLVRSDGTWKLSAVRTLALPRLHYAALQGLEEKPDRTANEEWTLEQWRRLTWSDESLKAFARGHRNQLEAIADALLQQPPGTLIRGEELENEADRELWAAIHTLHLNVVIHDRQGWIDLNLGGILDNAVGFLFVPANVTPPRMNPENFILLDPLGDGWYLYKTT